MAKDILHEYESLLSCHSWHNLGLPIHQGWTCLYQWKWHNMLTMVFWVTLSHVAVSWVLFLPPRTKRTIRQCKSLLSGAGIFWTAIAVEKPPFYLNIWLIYHNNMKLNPCEIFDPFNKRFYFYFLFHLPGAKKFKSCKNCRQHDNIIMHQQRLFAERGIYFCIHTFK